MMILLYGYDDYLITEQNIETFLKRLKDRIVPVHGYIECDGDKIIIDIEGTLTKSDIKFCEDFWEADSSRTEFGDNGAAQRLYEIIDDVDTIADIAGGNDKLYRKLVENRIKDRFKFCHTDGYKVWFCERL